MKFNKTKAGNYYCYYLKHYVFIYKRPHNGWCCRITKQKSALIIYQEGYFTTSLNTLSKAKQYAKNKLTTK